MILLALDQQTDTTGYALFRDDTPLPKLGALITPSKCDDPAKWQQVAIHGLIRHVRMVYAQGQPFELAVEGTFLAEYTSKQRGRNGQTHTTKAVTTKEALDRLIGRLQAVCVIEGINTTIVPIHAISAYLDLRVGVPRYSRKLATLRRARLLIANDLPEHAAAMLNAIEYLEGWHGGNKDGEPKSGDTMLRHASLHYLQALDCTVDSADALVIGEVARAMIKQEEWGK